MTTWLIVADDAKVSGLLDLARALPSPLAAVVAGTRELADQVAGWVPAVTWFDTSAVPASGIASAVAGVVAADPGTVVAGMGVDSRLLAGAVAAATGAEVLADVIAAIPSGDGLRVTHLLLGGLATEEVGVIGPVVLVADGRTVPEPGSAAGTVTPAAADASVARVSTEPPAAAGGDLASAARVVGVGRGLKDAGDLSLVQELAAALGAELACSRPIAEGMGWLPTSSYLGISGQRIAPSLYLAVGISGQGQHMIGVRDARTIVAVNSDATAPIVAQADWTIVGDLYQVVPELTRALLVRS
ncbi:MAG: electron transfer flavoprotein subunit alpha/FixB family protein [Actinobacteria bacterium HGW-Actinobacteria-5]|nr:MAG: electron transfer flavoprotein subunit alpha/FixB family protein [Actinobacteria bacterium HGW-Actinobacteria-5]